MNLTQSQVAELKGFARQSGTAHLRVKALALLSCGEGRSNSEVAAIFQVGRSTVAAWRRRYEAEGIEGFRVKPGRGRPRKADPDEIARYILQSPRNFGIERTRWTLELLARTVPSLQGFTRYGVQQALRKAGFRYKRGQPSLHSPDPEYGQKGALDQALKEARQHPGKIVVLFQDECSFYRQPSTGYLWSWMGRAQPKMKYASRNNTRMRIVGYLNACTGALHAEDMESVTAKCLAENVANISDWYPEAQKIFLVWDNWPNHHSRLVKKAIEKQDRVEALFLPTYAPWLNPIEKVWRRTRQNVTHAHPWCDDFREFRRCVHKELESMAEASAETLEYVGLMNC